MTILDELKEKKITISCKANSLDYDGNTFGVTKLFDQPICTSSKAIAVELLQQHKVCKIVNGKFAWIMMVDGTSTTITNPDYFKEHYKSLGYTIEEYNENT